MRVGLLGGSFNPPHRGHLAMAQAVRRALGLDRVLLIPAARPPHKDGAEMPSPEHRLAMTRLLAAEDPDGLEVSDIELRRAGPSYTIDTVAELEAARPGDELFFIIGADTVGELSTWRRAPELLRRVRFVVVNRPGHPLEDELEELSRELGPELARDLGQRVVTMEPVPISSTEVRRQVRAGEDWAGAVTPGIASYIRAERLYEGTTR